MVCLALDNENSALGSLHSTSSSIKHCFFQQTCCLHSCAHGLIVSQGCCIYSNQPSFFKKAQFPDVPVSRAVTVTLTTNNVHLTFIHLFSLCWVNPAMKLERWEHVNLLYKNCRVWGLKFGELSLTLPTRPVPCTLIIYQSQPYNESKTTHTRYLVLLLYYYFTKLAANFGAIS